MPRFCDCETGKKARSQYVSENYGKIEEFRQRKVEKALERSGISPKFIGKKMSDLSGGFLDLVTKYVENFPEYSKKGWGFYVWGDVGVGKTHAAMVVANALIERYQTETMFITLSQVAERVKKSFDGDNTDKTLWDELKTCRLLVIDDIGVEKASDWLREHAYGVINYRYEHSLPVIFTSNQSPDDLGAHFGRQIVSRMTEMCKVVKLTGEDRRKKLGPSF